MDGITLDFRTRITYQKVGIPRRFWEGDIPVSQDVRQWAEEVPDILLDLSHPRYGQGLVICGPNASAEMAWLCRYSVHQALRFPLFLDWGSFVDDVSDKDLRSDAMSLVNDPEVLFVDQVVSLDNQRWTYEVLSRIMKSRYDAGRPTVLSTSKSVETAQSRLLPYLEFDPSCVRFIETLSPEG